MSDDNNPSDAALEGGSMADISNLQGFRGHGPKLSTQSRAINPRALLAMEAAAQSQPSAQEYDDQPYAEEAVYDPAPRRAAPPARPPMQRRPEPSTLPRGMPRVLPPPMRPAPPPPPPVNDDARAWDVYASAALQATMALVGTVDPSSLCEHVALIADLLLEERRRRFA